MGIAQSALASGVGITSSFKDFRQGGGRNLPQRILVLAQGATAASFSTDKWQATSAGASGTKYGFGSMAHLILRELLPANGDGVGTIPIDVCGIEDDGSGVAASGTVTPSGTPAEASSARLRVNGILSQEFVIAAGALTTTALYAALRAMGDAVDGVLEMPVTMSFTYGAVTASALSGTGNGTLTALSVTGNPRPGVYRLQLKTSVVNGGVWTLLDPDGDVAADDLTQTVGASSATVFNEAGLQFTITDGTTDFSVPTTTHFDITVPATNFKPICKWKGASGNDLVIEVITDSTEVTYAVSQPSGGLVNPSIAAALAQVGNVWDTLVINGFNIEDTTTLDLLKTFGDGRWGTLVHKPLMAFVGQTQTDVDDATEITDDRPTDKVNVAITVPGCVNLPCVVAAAAVARIARIADSNPPTGYGSQQLPTLIPGADGDQWDYETRDIAVKRGCCTSEVVDGVVQLREVVTMYHPEGEEPAGYRYVVQIVRSQNVIFRLNSIFAAPAWASAPLIPDGQPTVNPNAKSPSMAKAAIGAMLDDLGLEAILSDPESAKKNTRCTINSQNPNRLDVVIPTQNSGNTEIKDIEYQFGFFFGQLAA